MSVKFICDEMLSTLDDTKREKAMRYLISQYMLTCTDDQAKQLAYLAWVEKNRKISIGCIN